MFQQSLKSLFMWIGLVLLGGLFIMNWENSRVEAASPSAGPAVIDSAPILVVNELGQPGQPPPHPAADNPMPIELVIGILQNTRVKKSIHSGFQALNESSLQITPLEGSVPVDYHCQLDGGLPLLRCYLVPPGNPAPPGEPTRGWEAVGHISVVISLATADGEVAETLRHFVIQPPGA
jgi:hypothetical protein